MAVWNPRANELFLNALEIQTPHERRAYLDSACAGDESLRKAVEALLQAHAEASGFLQVESATATAAPNTDATPSAPATRIEGPGTVIAGRYKLLEQIGEGGMGSVWMAEQTEPVKRMVALKLIKPGLDSGQVLARFEAERQALALMDHPNIAKVLDAGATEAGRPYFVMELVKGIPITKYCDEQQLSSRQRLELTVPVCQAIQHAHQKGIIHRDIKPSNVLVASYDGRPVPKVIDFGVSKATGQQQLTERTLFTGFGSIVGTLEYMSPEQAEFNALDIDTRSDIYSLGVLMYELLTGTTPLMRDRLKQAGISEVLRMIREEEPPKPSTRLSETRHTDKSRPNQRQMETARFVRGEVDWIVMKALDKDRNRRYETANGLALDIERYLKDEPVLAGPPARTYRLRKFVKRNRGPVLAAAVVLLTLLFGIVGTSWGLVEAQDERDRAEEARGKEADQRRAAVEQREEAEKQRDLVTKEKARVDKEFKRAEEAKAKAIAAQEVARQNLVQAQQSLFTTQVARAAGLWQSDPVQAMQLLRDDSLCPPPARDFAWHYYDRLCRTEKTLFANKGGVLRCVAFSPDGKLLAAGCIQGTIQVWDFASGKLLHHIKRGHEGPVWTVVFSRDGKTLISGGKDKYIQRWDVSSGKSSETALKMSGSVYGLAVHPDGQSLLAGSYQSKPPKGIQPYDTERLFNGEVVMWDLKTGAKKEFLRGNKSGVLHVAISPDGKLAAAATSHDFHVRLWETDTGKDYGTFQGDNSHWVEGLAFSHDGKYLAFGSANFNFYLWDVVKKTAVRTYAGHAHELVGVAFSPNDRLLASCAQETMVRLWEVHDSLDLDNPRERMVLRDCYGPIAFTPDGKGLIVQKSNDRKGYDLIHQVLPAQGEFLTLEGHEYGIREMAFSPDGKRLASLSKDRSAHLWSPSDGSKIPLGSYPEPPNCVVFAPDNQTVFIGASLNNVDKKKAGQIARWNTNGQRLEPWLGHASAVTALAVSGKHQLLASGSADIIKLWDLTTGEEKGKLDLKGFGIQALAFHPSARILAGLSNNVITLWDLQENTFKEREKFQRFFSRGPEFMPKIVAQGPLELPERQGATSLLFTEKHLVFNTPFEIVFYDFIKKQRRELGLPVSMVATFAVTPDEKTVAVGQGDRAVQLWDVASRQLRATLTGHVREISALAFSPDGTMLASGDHNLTFLAGVRGGTIKLWNAAPRSR